MFVFVFGGVIVCVAQQKSDVSIPGFELSARHRSQRSSGFCRAAIIPQQMLVMAGTGGVRQRHGCQKQATVGQKEAEHTLNSLCSDSCLFLFD